MYGNSFRHSVCVYVHVHWCNTLPVTTMGKVWCMACVSFWLPGHLWASNVACNWSWRFLLCGHYGVRYWHFAIESIFSKAPNTATPVGCTIYNINASVIVADRPSYISEWSVLFLSSTMSPALHFSGSFTIYLHMHVCMYVLCMYICITYVDTVCRWL